MQLLQNNLQPRSGPGLPPQEAELLQRINHSLSAIEWHRYRALLDKRRAETLTPEEQAELIALSDQIEEANARRIQAVAELAHLRQTTVGTLVTQMGLKPAVHG